MLPPELGDLLLRYARGAIAARLGRAIDPLTPDPRLEAPGASFVTLRQSGALRGCIGSLAPRRGLKLDVEQNALAAAFADPRFPPLADHEFEMTTMEVSVLSRSEPVRCVSESDLIAQLRRGVDGVTLALGTRQGTFLPQVWESLPDARAFVRELKLKAGLPADFWSADLAVSRYTVDKFSETAALVSVGR